MTPLPSASSFDNVSDAELQSLGGEPFKCGRRDHPTGADKLGYRIRRLLWKRQRNAMSLSLQIVHDASGNWSVHGLPGQPIAYLASLVASLEYARKGCAEAPATIELIVDGTCSVIHQERGWPRHPVVSAGGAEQAATMIDYAKPTATRPGLGARLIKKWSGGV